MASNTEGSDRSDTKKPSVIFTYFLDFYGLYWFLWISTSYTFGQKIFNPVAPVRGSFPLDHEGECKKCMLWYMIWDYIPLQNSSLDIAPSQNRLDQLQFHLEAADIFENQEIIMSPSVIFRYIMHLPEIGRLFYQDSSASGSTRLRLYVALRSSLEPLMDDMFRFLNAKLFDSWSIKFIKPFFYCISQVVFRVTSWIYLHIFILVR